MVTQHRPKYTVPAAKGNATLCEHETLLQYSSMGFFNHFVFANVRRFTFLRIIKVLPASFNNTFPLNLRFYSLKTLALVFLFFSTFNLTF